MFRDYSKRIISIFLATIMTVSVAVQDFSSIAVMAAEVGPGIEECEEHAYVDGVCTDCGAIDPDYVNPGDGSKGAGGSDDTPGAGGSGDIPGAGDLGGGSLSGDNHGSDNHGDDDEYTYESNGDGTHKKISTDGTSEDEYCICGEDFYCELCGYEWDMDEFPLLGAPVGMSPFSLDEYEILVNGTNIAVDASHNIKFNTSYGSSLTYVLKRGGAVVDASDYDLVYALKTDADALSENIFAAFEGHGLTSGDRLIPGEYYVTYSLQEGGMPGDVSIRNYGIKIIKSPIAKVTDLKADETLTPKAGNPNSKELTALKVEWTVPTKDYQNNSLDEDIVQGYSVDIYKKGKDVAIASLNSEDNPTLFTVSEGKAYCDIFKVISTNGFGEYSIKVKAYAKAGSGDNRYSESDITTLESYEYKDLICPEIADYTAIYDSKNDKYGFKATLTDNVGVEKYAFTTSSTSPVETDAAWKTIDIGDGDVTNYELKVFSEEFESKNSGSYYLHVMDQDGNIVTSTNTNFVTKVTLEKHSSGQEDIDYIFLGTVEDNADMGIDLPDDVEGSGLDFEGWYEKEIPGDDDSNITGVVVSSESGVASLTEKILTIPAGVDKTLHAKWASQNYEITYTSSVDGAAIPGTMEYNGSGDACGLTITAKLGNKKYPLKAVVYDSGTLTYEWYQKHVGEDILVATHTVDSLTDTLHLTQVSETGTYYAKVIFTVNDSPQTVLDENAKEVAITRAPLSFTIKDKQIGYGDPIPTDFEIKSIVGLMTGDSVLDQITGLATTYNVESPEYSKAGDYSIYSKGTKVACNYDVSVTNGTLTVGRKDVSADGSGVTLKFYNSTTDSYSDTYEADYTGSDITPDIVAFYNDAAIANEDGSQYTVSYESNISATTEESKAYAVASFGTDNGNFSGILKIPFEIKKVSFTMPVVMKKGDGTVITDSSGAVWTYGETSDALIPIEQDNPTPTAAVFYYAPKSAGTTLNRSTATTTQPVDAGEWYVWGYVPETDNHVEVTSEPFEFHIEKRTITLTAASHVGASAFQYNGKVQADHEYTQTGTFAYSDAFKSVTVSGAITDVGTVDNIISYELTPTTNPDNYNIITNNGILEVKPIILTTPSGLAWSDTHIGTLEWTPISQNNLTVQYQIDLYREGNPSPIATCITESAEHAFADDIRSDSEANGAGEYYAKIKTMPKEVPGEAHRDYTESDFDKSTSLYTTKLVLDYSAAESETTVKNAYFIDLGNGHASRYVICGETVSAQSESKEGYNNAIWECDSEYSSNVDIFMTADLTSAARRIRFKNPGSVIDQITIKLTAKDSAPVINHFTVTNSPDTGYNTINYDFEVYDYLGLEGYALINGGSEKASELRYEIINGKYPLGELTSFGEGTDGRYTVHTTSISTGHIFLVVKDIDGNITISSDDDAVYTYNIQFDNGKAAAEDADLFSGSMSAIYKVANTTIPLPENKFTKTGYDFKNWSSDTAGIYNDKAGYAANQSTTLRAQWTNSAYPYTVNYYYMDTEGNYPELESPTESKQMNGSYNAVISSTTGAIQQSKLGFTLDTSSVHVNSVTLGTDENPVVNVYYSRNKYKITYKYEDPTTSTSVSEYDSFYYEQEYTVREPLSLVGYTFVGWSIANFDTDKESTMPARDLEATGSFTADVVKYYVNYYFQNLPNSTGTIADGDYSETKSEVYTLDSTYSVAYLSYQGAQVDVCVPSDIKSTDLPDVDGFTISAVTLTKGAQDGTSKPAADDAEGTKVVTKDKDITGTVDATPENTLYVNYYYDRNDYDVTLTVWKDKRDVEGNDMYSKTWRISYGRPFTSEETHAMENFGYSETLSENKWIKNEKTQWVDSEGNIKEEFKSYELANYANWSSGASHPNSMPSGDVAITKEYVLITTAQYIVEFYMQTIDKDNNVIYPADPTYSVYYYEAIGKNVEIKKEKVGEEADTPTNAYLYYDDIGKMLDANYESYVYDDGQTNVMSGVVVKPAEDGTGELVLKLYFKRAKMPVTITYQYLPKSAAEGGEAVAAQKIVSYDVWAEWGTHIQINPTEYFYASSSLPADRIETSYSNYSEFNGTPSYTDFKVGTADYSVDYNSKPCEISYSGFTYIKSRGNSWPNHIYTAESELYDTESDTYKTIDFEVGQGKKGASLANRLTITYSELAENNTYYMNETWGNPNPVTEEGLIVEALVNYDENKYYQIARFKDFDENGEVQYSYKYYGKPDTEDGTATTKEKYDEAVKYYIRIANKKDIFKATGEGSTSGTSKYKAETYISNATQPSTYDYSGGLKDGYSTITVTTQYGTDSEYYLKTEDGKNYIYIANLKNSFFAGNYVYFNAESPDYCSNAAKLGFTDAWTRRSNGYDVYDETTYNIHQNIYTKMWDHPDNYTFSQREKDRQIIYLQFGSKSTTYDVTYGTVYNNPYNDTHVNTTFSVDDGYRIVWYEDSDYTKPVSESSTYIANKRLNFYGRREKDLITSYDFISYELSDVIKTKLPTVENYVNQSNYATFFGDKDAIIASAKDSLTGSGKEVIADTIERTYLPDDSETPKSYTANRYKLYVDGSLVVAIVENKSLSYSTIELPYHNYEEDGFEYSERDKNNISKGYVQKDGIYLRAYYHRNSYNLSVIMPSTVNDQHDASYDYVKMYEDDVVLSDPTKKGYTFDGWKFTKISKDGTETEVTSAALAKYERYDEGKETFIMPAYDLRVEAKWKAASFDYDIISYFQQAGGTYEGAISGYDNITKASVTSDITLNLNGVSYGADNKAKLYKNGGSVVGASFELGGNTYFFINPTVEGGTASVTSAKLVAAKSTKQFTTAVSYNVGDYKLSDADLDVFSIFSYAFTTYVSETENLSLSSDKTFTALPDMTLNYFYDRSVSYKVRIGSIASDATADKDSASGLDITGAGNDFHYGDEATLVATLEPGYEFKGWYYASEVLPDTYTGASVPDLDVYKYVDPVKIKLAGAIPSIETTNDHERKVYTAKPEITDNVDFIAVATPVDFTTITVGVTIKAGRTDYTYGYAASTENYLQAQVSIPDEYKDKVSVTGYQWYEVEAADAAPTEHNLIPGANSATYLVPTGMNAGNHFYQCVVTLKRTDNGREGHEHATSALNLVVKKYGESADPDHPVLYHNADNYEGIYDGASHSISLRMKETGMVPSKYEIYYSESPMTTWEDVEAGLSVDTPTVFHEVNNTIPDRFRYTDVLLDEGGAVASRTVYYYIRTEDDALDSNFKDAYGSNTVTIKPVVMTMSRTTNAFSKVYDASESVTDSDYARLLNGDGTKQFFRLNNGTMFGSESDNLTLSFDANFNSMHVDDANAVILSNICVKYKTGDKAGQVNPNYAFTPGYTCSLSGYITAYPLHLVWSSVDSFVYDGALHARETHLKDGYPAPPDADLEIISIGSQINKGSYTATASLNTVGKTYKASDYSFDITTAPYSITACPITVSPKDTTYTYNRLTQRITEYEITRGATTYAVNGDGTSTGLFNSQNLVMSAIKNDKGRKEAGNETVTTVAGTVKIYESGKDVTYNYDVTYGSGTLTIDKKVVTLAGATGVSKQYDGNASAELLSTEKTINGALVNVLAEGTAPSITAITPTDVITGDEVFIDASKTSSVLFADKNVGDGKTITFNLDADSLVGADADNYELNIAGSTLTASANITKQQILVKVKDLSSGTIYGETPAFAVEYSGFKGGDTSAVITGSVTYMLTDTTAEGSAVEVSTYLDGVNNIYKIPVITDGDGLAGYALSLKLDSDGYVDGLSADDYCFVPYAAPYIQETYEPKLVITKREISVTGKDRAPVITKTYDGDTDVDDAYGNQMSLLKDTDYELSTQTGSGATAKGLLPGDAIDITCDAAYNSANVSDASKITATNLKVVKASGALVDASNNYVLTSDSFSVSGTITPKDLTVTAVSKTITYGDAAPTYTATATGFVAADGEATQTLTNGSGITLTCDYINEKGNDNRVVGEYEIVPSALTNTNYNLVAGSSNGKLTVGKKEIVVTTEEKKVIYGKDSIPNDDLTATDSNYTKTFTGWISAYGETADSVLGTAKSNVTATLERTAEDDADASAGKHNANAYPYKSDGYKVNVGPISGSELTTDNYSFKYVPGKLMVYRQYISVHNIKTEPKVYDGKTNVASFVLSDVTFTCYASNISTESTYTAAQLLPSGANIAANLEVTGTYDNKNVGTDKTVTLNLKLKEGSYLDSRYTLIEPGSKPDDLAEYGVAEAEASQGTTTDGVITKKDLKIQIYYASKTSSEIKYGESIDTTKFGWYDVAPYEFVTVDGVKEGLKELKGQIGYDIVNASGDSYTTTSPVGTYYVKYTGNLSDDGTNYSLTIIGTSAIVTGNPVDVKPNTLATPAPVWSETNPGTITWNEITGYGEVNVKEYSVKLYKNDGSTIDPATASPLASQTVAATADRKVDFASTIRSEGPGAYKVYIEALAETGEKNPIANRNVLDSAWGASVDIFAANVIVSYSGSFGTADEVTQGAISGDASKIEINSVAYDTTEKKSAYCMISGETAPVSASWINVNGYNTGYTRRNIVSDQTDEVAISNISDNSALGSASFDVKVTLTKKDDVNIKLALDKRPATITGTIEAIRGEAYYGFENGLDPAADPSYRMNATPSALDNLTLSGDVEADWPYRYEYTWTYGSGISLTGTTETNGKREIIVSATPIIPAKTYNIKCVVKATRKDNGETITGTYYLQNGMKILKAVIGDATAKASVADWTYGEARQIPTLTRVSGGVLPDGIGTVHYYFREGVLSSWQEWTSTVYPQNAGTYSLMAKIDGNDNYDSFNTAANTTTFTISATKLNKHTDNSTALTASDLKMMSTSKAPYGLATFKAAYGPKENTDSTTNFITPSYEVILYEGSIGSGTQKKKYTSEVNIALDGTGSVDVSDDMNHRGEYYFTVQAISDNTDNCENSDVFTSPVIKVYDNLVVKSEKTGSELAKTDEDGKYHYTYDGSNVVIEMTAGVEGTTNYKWFKDSVEIEGATGATNSSYKVRYVDGSGYYSCQITVSGQTYESSTVYVQIDPRQLTIATGTAEKNYDGTPLTKDEWWVVDSDGNSSSTKAASSGSVVEVATNNNVSGISVTGTKTNVSVDAQNTITTSDNTYDLSGLVIKEPARTENGNVETIVYNASMASAGKANYTFADNLGTLKINKAKLTITSGTADKSYDGSPLVKHTCETGVTGEGGTRTDDLLSGDHVETINYTGTITNVYYVDGAVSSVDNTFDGVQIVNTDGTDVTDSYDITNVYGKLTITPRSSDALSAEITNAKAGTLYDFDWTGSNITPTVLVKYGDVVLVEGTDYTLSGDITKKAVSTANTITVTLKGNYSGTKTLNWKILDIMNPTGKIKFSSWDTTWSELLEKITFGLYQNDNVTVTVSAKEESGGSGIADVKYYVDYKPATDGVLASKEYTTLTQAELEALGDSVWSAPTGVTTGAGVEETSGTFEIAKDTLKQAVVYARIKDMAGHITYICSNGLVIDSVLPSITGTAGDIASNTTYCLEKEFTVKDRYLSKVEILNSNGVNIKTVSRSATDTSTTDGFSFDATGVSYTYKLVGDPKNTGAAGTTYTIKATDLAGNVTTLTGVRVNSDHTWNYVGNNTEKLTANCTVDGCTHHSATDITVEISATGGDFIDTPYPATVTVSDKFTNVEASPAGAKVYTAGTVGTVKYYKTTTENAISGGMICSGAPKNAGFYYAECNITGKNGQSLRVVKPFTINQVALKSVSVANSALIYTGSVLNPGTITVEATVNGSDRVLVLDTDYTLTNDVSAKKQTSATKVGTYTVEAIANPNGNYYGNVTCTYTITDNVIPEFSSDIADGGIYCKDKDFAASDATLKEVTILVKQGDGTYAEDSTAYAYVPAGSTATTWNYRLYGTPEGREFKITIADESNNTKTINVKVFDDHKFVTYTDIGVDAGRSGLTEANCENGCGAKDYAREFWGEVKWNYAYSYTLADGLAAHDGVQNVGERATYARVELLRDDVVIATRYVNCKDICGTDAASPADDTTGYKVEFSFDGYKEGNPTAPESECTDVLLRETPDGVHYIYSIRVTPIKDETSTGPARDFNVIPNKYYGSRGDLGDVFSITYNPNCFNVPWKVTLKGIPEEVAPDTIYVKVLYATYADAKDNEYNIITQQNTGTGYACTQHVAEDGSYYYVGSYPVWEYIAGTTNSYYHRIQVVGYDSVDVSAMGYRSICDADHVNHTIYFTGTGASGTILYEVRGLSLAGVPLVVFDENGGTITSAQSSILLENVGDDLTADQINAVTASRGGYNFAGWYDAPSGGNRITSLENVTDSVTLYAHWSLIPPPRHDDPSDDDPGQNPSNPGGPQNPGPQGPKNPDEPGNAGGLPGSGISTPIAPPTNAPSPAQDDTAEDKKLVKTPTNGDKPDGSNPSGNNPNGSNPNGKNPSDSNPSGGDSGDKNTGIENSLKNGNLEVVVEHIDASENATDKNNNPGDGNSGNSNPGKGSGQGSEIITADLPNPGAVADAVLTEKEKKLLEDGGNIIIRLIVDDKKKKAPTEEENPGLAKLLGDIDSQFAKNGEKAIFKSFVDLRLEKSIDSAEWERILSTGEAIDVVINLPDAYVLGAKRAFLARRDGSGYVILEDLDDDPNTITINTNDFDSEYVLVTLEDEEVPLAGFLPENCFWHWFIVATALVWLILILITLKKRKEEEDENADLGENTNLDMNSISSAGISGSTPVTSGYGGKGKYDESELEELAKKSRNRRWLALLPYAILIVVFTILGDCKWEIPCDVIGTLVVGVADYATWKHKFKEADKEERR